MKRIRKSRAARILTWIVTITMIAPIFCGIIAPVSALAQAPNTAVGTTQVVIVLDFQNRSGVGGSFLAGLAADEVRVSLSNSDRYQLIKRDEVVRAANQLGLKPPYDNVAISRLSTELGATTVVDGTIENVSEDTKHGPRQVSVTLLVRVRDTATGDLISGAAQIGTAVARPGQTDRDSLLQEATSNAAVQAVKQILSYNLPEGTVLSTVGTLNVLVLINRGSRDGVKEGLELVVTREHQRVGKLVVTNVFPTDSEAKIVENTLGIQPQDKVRAIFPMPIVTAKGFIQRQETRHNNSAKTLGQILVVLLVGLVIASAATGGSSTVTGVVSEADTQNDAPAVQMVWRDTIFGSGSTLEYHVWRLPDFPFNFTGNPIAAVPAGTRSYTDFARPYSFWDGVRSFLQVGVPTGNNGGGGGNNTGTQATATVPAATVISGFPRTGDTFTYLVSAVIRRPLPTVTTGGNGGGGGGGGNAGGGTEDVESGTVTGGPTTPLDKPILSTPVDQKGGLDGNNLLFNWSNPIGADTFQIEISTDPTFKNRNLIKIAAVTIPMNSVTVTDLVAFLDNILKNDPTWLAFRAGTSTLSNRIYWRIGARKNIDRPGPKHWITRNPHDSDSTFRFIYSNPRSFTLAPLPPNPPGKATRSKR